MGNLKDYATGIVATAPSPATSGTSLTLQAGQGARMPAVPFSATAHPANAFPTLDNAEKIEVTAVSTDTLTIVRAQGDTTAKSIAIGWRISNAVFEDDLFNTTVVKDEVPAGAINGSNTTFTTANTAATGSLTVYKNGVRMRGGGNDYTQTATGFTMTTAPATGTVLLCDYAQNLNRNIIGANTLVSGEVPTGTINGTNKTFTTAGAYAASSLEVWVNGVYQKRVSHFTETTPGSGVFDFIDAPEIGDNVLVSYQSSAIATGNADTLDGYHAQTLIDMINSSDWINADETLHFSSWDATTRMGVVNVSTGAVGKYALGTRVQFNQSTGGTKTAIIQYVEDTKLHLFLYDTDVLNNEALNSVKFSRMYAPLGFDPSRDKWTITHSPASASEGSPAAGNYYSPGDWNINAPVGSWTLKAHCYYEFRSTTSTIKDLWTGISTAIAAPGEGRMSRHYHNGLPSSTKIYHVSSFHEISFFNTSQTTWYIVGRNAQAPTEVEIRDESQLILTTGLL